MTDQEIVISIDDIRHTNTSGKHQVTAFLFGHRTTSFSAYGDEFAAHLHSALVTLMSDVDDWLTTLEMKLLQMHLDESNTMRNM